MLATLFACAQGMRTYTESGGRSVMTSEDECFNGCDEHIPCFLVQWFRVIICPLPLTTYSDGIVNGVVRQVLALLIDFWLKCRSIIHDAANIAVEGSSMPPLLVVSARVDIIQISRPEVRRSKRCLLSEKRKELIVFQLGVALELPVTVSCAASHVHAQGTTTYKRTLVEILKTVLAHMSSIRNTSPVMALLLSTSQNSLASSTIPGMWYRSFRGWNPGTNAFLETIHS